MDPERDSRARAIVLAVRELDPGRRDALLEAECGADRSLRSHVEALLAQMTAAPTARLEADAPEGLTPGTVVAGRYRIEAELGAGGMGRVFRATQLALGREVALKVLPAGPDASPSALKRLEREAAAVARLRHPNIVTVYDAGTEPGIGAFFAMELVRGRSLLEELRARGRLPVAEAVDVVRQIAEAVEAAHQSGVVHRDLKPANVMLDGDGGKTSVRVLDFGIAKLVGEASDGGDMGLTATGATVGTPVYMAPEQARAETVDARVDIWGLGVTLYELVTGVRPFARGSAPATFAAILAEEPEPLDRAAPGVPPALARFVGRTLAKRPADRPAAAREVADALAEIAAGLSGIATAPVPVVSAKAPSAPTAETESLVGREEELEELANLVRRPGVRLVTLTGPGGAGKTRLARALAHALREEFEHGTTFVDLSGLESPDLVVPTIARELGVREEGATPIADLLAARMRDARALLVLDNFEQVLAAGPAIADLMRRAPRLVVLATSRTPLRLRAEHVRFVQPLAVPEDGAPASPAELTRCASVALFVERARSVKKGFELTERNAADVAAICRELDGLPLALELAAVRLKLLSPAALRARLGERLGLLTRGDRDLSERQQTMRGAIGWSYDLLEEDARRLFERLSVFASGWRLEQAEAVARAAAGGPEDTVLALESLVEGSLVVASDEADGEVRFRMLNVVREFARERLAERGELDAVARAHAEAYRELAFEAVGYLTGEHMAEWLARLEQEHDNFRAALAWSLAHDPEICLRLAGLVGNLWTIHEHYAEGRRWLDEALRRGAGAPAADRAKALRKAGTIARQQGDLAAAQSYYGESLRVSEETGDPAQLAWASVAMAHLMQDLGDVAGARMHLERSLVLAEQTGLDRVSANALNDLGELAFLESDYALARSYYDRAMAIFGRVGDPDGIATTKGNLGVVLLFGGDVDAADALLREALAVEVSLGTKHGVLSAINALAAVAAARGRWDRAALLAASAEAHCAAIGYVWDLPRRRLNDWYASRLVEGLGEAGLEACEARGRALTLDDTIALALERDG